MSTQATTADSQTEEYKQSTQCRYALVFHGGAGNLSTSPRSKTLREQMFHELHNILRIAHNDCLKGANGEITVLDIVENVVKLLEDCVYFNAGKGSVFARNGKHEMEASVMNGKDLRCGAVSLLRNIKNPISVAVDIMNTTPHIYVVGAGAVSHIQHLLRSSLYYSTPKRTPPNFEPDSYFWSKHRWNAYENLQLQSENATTDSSYSTTGNSNIRTIRSEDEDEVKATANKAAAHDGVDEDDLCMGTVGCVAMLDGNVAAATSTGGMTGKLNGRVGDTPIIGSGTYANNKFGAVSCTGVGEEFMRHVTAYDIIARVKYCHVSIQQAIEQHLSENFESGIGGAIAVDKNGDCGIAFNTSGMIRGWLSASTTTQATHGYVAILENDQQKVDFT